MTSKKALSFPEPSAGESPTKYATRMGENYCSTQTTEFRKEFGIYFTPERIARYMATLRDPKVRPQRILDPAAGSGILLCALVEDLVVNNKEATGLTVEAYEVDPILCCYLERVLAYLKEWSIANGWKIKVAIKNEDFILANGEAIQRASDSLSLCIDKSAEGAFDIIIANPPYFKLQKSDARAQAASSVVYGQPNIYGLFMAVGAALLRNKGDFIYIIPRSFASGPYFKLLRKRFFSILKPTRIHIFDSRNKAFKKDAVLQENIILRGVRRDNWVTEGPATHVTISSSHDVEGLSTSSKRKVPIEEILTWQTEDKVLRLPATTTDDEILKQVDSWPETLLSLGMNISTGPVVPFRATEFLAHESRSSNKHAPLLWMHHVRPLSLVWPNGTRKPQYIKHEAAERKLLLPNANYVVLRRFSAKEEKRRLTAAAYLKDKMDCSFVGLENHLNYIHRPGGELTEDEVWGLATLFSSSLLDSYFRIINGNTQVSATELRVMPIPDGKEIVVLGKKAKKLKNPLDKVDELVLSLFSPTKAPTRIRRVVNE